MFVPHHGFVASDRATRWLLVLHGIFGSGGNWRTFARKLTDRVPQWGAVLVDLRMHGRSQDARPPHTVAAAAGDLVALAGKLAGEGKPIHGICGHSFGGKVALAYRARAGRELARTWVLDASPQARPGGLANPDNTVAAVLRMLGAQPVSFASRDDFVADVEARGFAPGVARWLAMNLERRGDRYAQRLDLDAVESLLRDYYKLDSWPAIESGPGAVHVVIAGESGVVDAADQARLAELAARGLPVRVTRIEGSGHWLHIEALDRLLDVVAGDLAGEPASDPASDPAAAPPDGTA